MAVRKIKEKCKDAARMRREKERAEFMELSKLLPLPSSITNQLDKASVIRLTSCYLKMRSAFPKGLGHNWGANRRHQHHSASGRLPKTSQVNSCESTVRELGSLLLQTLDGFVLALHKDGKIMYISETASVLLGLPQIDLAGSSIFDYVLPSDHNDIIDALNLTEAERNQLDTMHNQTDELELARAFCMRMKCILPKRNAGLVTGGYKAIHCNGYLKLKFNHIAPVPRNSTASLDGEWDNCALVAVGSSLLPTASTELKLNSSSFMFRANLDLTLYFIEASFSQLLDFEQVEMTGVSLYKFVHTSDLAALESSHKLLLEKGQMVTRYYRLVKRTGGCIWIQSYATLVNNPRNMPNPQHIVSVCHILADESMIDGSCILPQSSNEQLELKEECNNEEKSTYVGYKPDKLHTDLTKETRIQATRNSKKLKTSSSEESCSDILDDIDCNMNYIRTQASLISKESNTYITNGSHRRISDDSSSIASSVASTQLQSPATFSITLPGKSLAQLNPTANTGSQKYYLKSPVGGHQQNLEARSNNILEPMASSYYDTCTQYLNNAQTEEIVPQFNSSWTINVPPTYNKQIPFNDLPPKYNRSINSCDDYCSCSSSPDWSRQNTSSSKCNLISNCPTKQQTHQFQSAIFHQFTDDQPQVHRDEQALCHYDHNYYEDTPYLIQYHQQVPINPSYSV